MKMNNKRKEIILILLVLTVAVLLGLNTTRYFGRIDMTKNKYFTISKITKDYIKTIPEQVNITYLVSDKIKTISPAAVQIEDLLFEYAANSRKHIVVNSVDPVKNNLQSYAKKVGIKGEHVQIYDKNEMAYTVVFSGILIQYMDKTEAIPFILDLGDLEYNVTSKIQKLVENITIKVGLLPGTDKKDIDSYYSYLLDDMKMSYETEVIERGKEIDSDISVLFVLGSKDLSDGDLLYIDEYMMNGGKVIFCIDGVEVDMKNNMKAFTIDNNPAIEMLKKWGISINSNLVLDKYCQKIVLKDSLPMNYPEWVRISSKYVSKENPVTVRLPSLDLLWASSIDLSPVENLKYEKLFSSTENSWLLDKYITANPYELYTTQDVADKTLGNYAMAYAVNGTFKSAFTDKVSPDTRIIVVSDADFISNFIAYIDSPQNMFFAENAVEWLSNDSFLNIKTRNMGDKRLNKISDKSVKVKAILLVYLVNILIIPAGIIVYGIFRYLRRKKKEA